MMNVILLYCFIFFGTKFCHAWDTDQLEVFDVVEEVKQNFYSLLNISQNASEREIKSAFRSLSLKLHPDKNPDVDTSEQFRNLVSVYEVLRSPVKRKYYDEVLVNGLPNWRSAVYYYRYVRKMGLLEACLILFIIISIGQYLMHWGAYFEKVYTIEQNKKRKSRRDKCDVVIEIPKPSVCDTLPIQIPRLMWYILISLPQTFGYVKSFISFCLEEARKKPEPPFEESVEVCKQKTVRKRKAFVVPEGPNFEQQQTHSTTNDSGNMAPSPPPISGGLWTDDDLAELVKLVKKYPGGTVGRWEIIAENLNRSVVEVTFMANKLKENAYRLSSEMVEEVPQPKVKQKTKKEVEITSENNVKNWTQIQQKALEEALMKYPKGCNDRWDRISDAVPNKTKEECMLRFRYLAENLKKQKESRDDIMEKSLEES